jgi:hypothetical protein
MCVLFVALKHLCAADTHAGGNSVSYRSNALNQRLYKDASGTVTRSIYGPDGALLSEIGPQGATYIWVGGELLDIVRGT